jgi:hypothetical protein
LPIEYEEPDVTCTIAGIKFGIAAKRIKSVSQVKDRIRKAADQIARAKLSGVIALELSLAWNLSNAPIISQIQSQMCPLILDAQSRQFFDEHREDIDRLVAGKRVLAVVAFNSRILLQPDNHWGLAGMTTWYSTTHDQKADHEYKTFYDGFMSGVPNVKDLADV